MLTTLDLKVLWRSVCAARGTATPVAEGLDDFLNGLHIDDRANLQNALMELKKGSDANEYFKLLRWGSACTHAHVPANAKEAGIECTFAQLFYAGCRLLERGVEPIGVLMHAEGHADEISELKLTLTQAAAQTEPKATAEVSTGLARRESEVPRLNHASPVDAEKQRLTLRLFGNTAAHTLELSDHRRAASFLGVSVVVIESAQPNQQGGFDWENKLTLQLTPEEMPEVIAVLLGIKSEASFTNHGADRNKSVSFRNQKDGLQIVTSRRSTNYSVPVKTSVVYYLLDLFCRAMIGQTTGRTNADVIATVRGVYT